MLQHSVTQVRQKAWQVKQVRQQVRQRKKDQGVSIYETANPLSCMVFPTGVEPVACPLGGDSSNRKCAFKAS